MSFLEKNSHLVVCLLMSAVLIAGMLLSCKNRHPDDVLPKAKMEAILFDYHLALSLAEADADSSEIKGLAYTDFVLKKHGITQADFDHSMEYYCRHTDELYEVYDKLSTRFDALTGQMSDRSMAGDISGDTLSLWSSPFCLLNANGQNRMQQTLEGDTTLRQGDHLIFDFSAAWYYHEGQKRLNTLLAIVYEGDSVVLQKRDFETSGRHTLTLTVGPKTVKRVALLVYQNAPWDVRPRMVALLSPRLLRVRRQTSPQPATTTPDTTRRDTTLSREHAIRDSLVRMDTARGGHFDGQQ